MTDTDVTVEQVLKLAGSLTQASGIDLGADTPLLSSGLIDSLSVADLAEQLESAFGVDISIADLGYDNADTAEQLTALINSKRA